MEMKSINAVVRIEVAMEQTNQIRINSPTANRSFDSTQANVWASQKIREKNVRKPVEYFRREENHQTLGEKHAIRTYRRLYLHACDQSTSRIQIL